MSTELEVLQVEIRNMADNVAHMRNSIDGMTAELKKISVLEEKHAHQSQSLGRAFVDIEKLESDLLEHKAASSKELESVKRIIWFGTGFLFAVSVLWTVFGVYMADTVRDTVKGVAEMRNHTLIDRVTSPDQVREIQQATPNGNGIGK